MVLTPVAEHLQRKRWLIPITNACNLSCGNCAQLCGHFTPDKIWHLSLSQLDQAIQQLKPFARPCNEVTIFGGEPTIHPQWEQVVELVHSHAPMQFRVNTNGRLGHFPFQRDKNITYYVDTHPVDQQFLTTMVASKDCIPSEKDNPAYFWELAQKDCPIWATEGAMVYKDKAYFCEHAAAMDHLFYDGANGWEIEDGTNPFDRTEAEIAEQAHKFCQQCGWCVKESGRQRVGDKTECTQSNYELFPSKKLLNLVTPPTVVERDYTRVEKAIDMLLHDSSTDQLKDWEYVATLIRKMGLYGATEEVYGAEKEHGTFDETGVWQEPTQSAKFLVWLADQNITNFLEVGSWNGCWALFMAVYLSRFGLKQAVSVDIENTVLPAVRRIGRENGLTFQQCGSDAYAGQSFDFTFIDGGREREVVTGHYENVGKHARVCAFHDIHCRFAPEIGKLWHERFKHTTSSTEYLDHAKGHGYDVFGIGVLVHDR